MNLFQDESFTSAAGLSLKWKVECDVLTEADLKTLAKYASAVLLPYGRVEGVPKGGVLFAACLREYIHPGSSRTLIVDDVLTTGKSMESFARKMVTDMQVRAGMVEGLTIFNRSGIVIPWIKSIFTYSLEP